LKAFFVSDIHIKDPEESNSLKLLLFLSQVHADKEATHLFLVGDIFDLWIENHDFFIKRYARIIEGIRDCVSRGIEVHYFEGNHDLYLNNFWQQDVGARVHEGPSFFNLKTKSKNFNVRVEHGDQMNPEDKGYLWLRWFLRTKPMTVIAKVMPGFMVRRIGERASQISRGHTSARESAEASKVKEITRRHSQQVYGMKAFDFLICGHTHVRDLFAFEVGEAKAIAVNLGSWWEGPQAFYIDETSHGFVDI